MNQKTLKIFYTIGTIFVAVFLVLGMWKEHHLIIESTLLQGQGTEKYPDVIDSDDDFCNFADAVNEGITFDDQYVSLRTDIDFSKCGHMIGEYGSSEITFSGVFNGNGHHIKNVNITAEEAAAGLFVNLSGTVCNLVIENGTISGPYAGAVAGSVYGKAKIFNCLNMAMVDGENTARMAGEFFGNIQNCISLDPFEDGSEGIQRIVFATYDNGEEIIKKQEFYKEQCEEDVDALNSYLNILSTKEHYSEWCTWKVVEGQGIDLTQEKETVLSRMQTIIQMDGNQITLEAYYGKDNFWYFAFPAGYKEDKRIIELLFSDGNSQKVSVGANEYATMISAGGVDYPVLTVVSAGIPTIMVNSDGGRDLQYLNDMKIHEIQGNISVLSEDGSVNYKGMLKSFTGRGNDSYASIDKIGFNLTLQNRVNLLDMGSNEDYVLISGYRDSSLLTYKITQDMEKAVGVANAPESRFVNVYVDNQYMGMYLLTEKIEIDENRIDIANLAVNTQGVNLDKLSNFEMESWIDKSTGEEKHWYNIPNDPQDITGGYLLEVDKMDYTKDQSRFKTGHNITVVSKAQKYLTKKETDYISDYWEQFEDALFSDTGYNIQGKYYGDYIDLDSYVDQWLFYELNGEISITGSVYYYKESDVSGDGLLHASYIWDVEHSFISDPQTLNLLEEHKDTMSGYWVAFYQYDDFVSKVHDTWNQRFVPEINRLLSVEMLNNDQNGVGSIKWYQHEYAQAALANQTRWPSCQWDEKTAEIREFLQLKSAYLTEKF